MQIFFFLTISFFRFEENQCKGDFLESVLPEGAGILPEILQNSTLGIEKEETFNSQNVPLI